MVYTILMIHSKSMLVGHCILVLSLSEDLFFNGWPFLGFMLNSMCGCIVSIAAHARLINISFCLKAFLI
jgi:hypothetical protein